MNMYIIYYGMKKNRKNSNYFEKNKLNSEDIEKTVNEKVIFLQNIIRNTIISIKNNKFKKIFSNNDAILSISLLTDLYENTASLLNNDIFKKPDQNKKIEFLQKITEKIIMIVSGFGTLNMIDLINIMFGCSNNFPDSDNLVLKSKIDLIINHIQPIGCKIIQWKQQKNYNSNIEIVTDKITEEIDKIEDACSYECYDIDKSAKSFYQKIFGIRVVIHNQSLKKTLIISGLVNDIQLDCFSELCTIIYTKFNIGKNISKLILKYP